jgi:hypothetical protein
VIRHSSSQVEMLLQQRQGMERHCWTIRAMASESTTPNLCHVLQMVLSTNLCEGNC